MEEYQTFVKLYSKNKGGFDVAYADLNSLPISRDNIVYDFFALAKELKQLDK